MELGYFLSSEEHGPRELLHQAQLAERVGIGSVWISDHYHPWLDEQGESPFVWSVIGAIAATTQLRVTTAVTCPTMRIHPAVIAHAAATSMVLLDGRFELGVGTGENLNEHILGDAWPITDQRLEMLEEAIDVIRQLWGGCGDHPSRPLLHGRERPPVHPPRCSAADRDERLRAEIDRAGEPDRRRLRIDDAERGTAWRATARTVAAARRAPGSRSAGARTATSAPSSPTACGARAVYRASCRQELRSPALFEQAASKVTVDDVAEAIPCGPDVDAIVAAAREYADAGFDRLYISQIGPAQEEFFDFLESDLASALESIDIHRGAQRTAQHKAAGRKGGQATAKKS